MVTPDLQSIMQELVRLQGQVASLSGVSQLAYSSIENGALTEFDATGQLVQVIGKQYDDTHTVSVISGPIPPTPTAAIVEPVAGGLVIKWDGLFADGSVTPMDFSRVAIYVSIVDGFNPFINGELLATCESPRGASILVSLPATPQYVKLLTVSQAGKYSSTSVQVTATPASLLSTADLDGISEQLATAQADVAAAQIDVAAALGDVAALDSKIVITDGKADAASAAAANAVTTAAADATAKSAAAQAAATSAAAITAQTKADAAKAAAIAAAATYAESQASGASASAIAAAATDAQTKASAAQAAAISAAAITAQSKADAAQSAATAAAATDAQTRATAAQNAAVASANTTMLTAVNGKNKIVFSTSDASGTAYTAGDVWFKKNSNLIVAQWEFVAGAWASRLVDGLTVANLNAGSITTGYLLAARIDTDTIIARHIKAGEVVLGKLAADSVTGTNIKAGTITALDAVFANAAIVAANIGSINADVINAGTIKAAQISTATLTGKTVTGGVIQTATSGRRLVISGANNDRIDWYTGDGSEQTAGQARVGVYNPEGLSTKKRGSWELQPPMLRLPAGDPPFLGVYGESVDGVIPANVTTNLAVFTDKTISMGKIKIGSSQAHGCRMIARKRTTIQAVNANTWTDIQWQSTFAELDDDGTMYGTAAYFYLTAGTYVATVQASLQASGNTFFTRLMEVGGQQHLAGTCAPPLQSGCASGPFYVASTVTVVAQVYSPLATNIYADNTNTPTRITIARIL